MSVADDFKAFRNNYLIPQATVSSISQRYRRITKQLNKDFWTTESETAHSLYVGSYGRDSAAKGVSDLDVAFQLPYEVYKKYDAYQSNGQSALLQAVKTSIAKTYSSTYMGGDGQVVAINFTDDIRFEILPYFLNTDGSFTFSDTNGGGSWKTCNPRAEMTAYAARNTSSNGNLKAICRMARIWKSQNNVPISGMLIDTLAYNFIESWEHKDKSYLYHDFLVRDFMYYLSVRDKTQNHWRAPGSQSYVWKGGNFQTPAATAYGNAVKAITNTVNSQNWAAREAWRAIFGTLYA